MNFIGSKLSKPSSYGTAQTMDTAPDASGSYFEQSSSITAQQSYFYPRAPLDYTAPSQAQSHVLARSPQAKRNPVKLLSPLKKSRTVMSKSPIVQNRAPSRSRSSKMIQIRNIPSKTGFKKFPKTYFKKKTLTNTNKIQLMAKNLNPQQVKPFQSPIRSPKKTLFSKFNNSCHKNSVNMKKKFVSGLLQNYYYF